MVEKSMQDNNKEQEFLRGKTRRRIIWTEDKDIASSLASASCVTASMHQMAGKSENIILLSYRSATLALWLSTSY